MEDLLEDNPMKSITIKLQIAIFNKHKLPFSIARCHDDYSSYTINIPLNHYKLSFLIARCHDD